MTRRAAALATIAACALAVAGPATLASAAGTPGTSAASRLLGPGARFLSPGSRLAAAGQRTMVAEAAPTEFTGALLYGVSCTGKAQCTATGLVTTRSGKNTRTLAERWNGTKWAVQSTPTPLTGGLQGGALAAGVSCTSGHACVAAGYSYSKNSFRLLGEGWNGTKWATQPLNKQPAAVLPVGIACTWAKNCLTVGLRGSGATVAEHWNGKKWSVLATKLAGMLSGVTCPGTANCSAVGERGSGKSLAEHWNGKTWSVQTTANPSAASPLFGVSCHPAGTCIAVGTTTASGITDTPLAEQWNGTKWANIHAVDPTAGDVAELDSVSCVSATDCWAVGDAGPTSGNSVSALAEQWNGSTWSVVSTPAVATFATLDSVSCTSASHCVAVGGDSATALGSVHTLVEVWNGTTWTHQTAPN
jgi:hypothetical protein